MQTPEYYISLVDASNQADYANQTFQWLHDDLESSKSYVEKHQDNYHYGSDENCTPEEELLYNKHSDNLSHNFTRNEKIIRPYFAKGNAMVACTKNKEACVGFLTWSPSEKGFGIEIAFVAVQMDHQRKGVMSLMIQKLCEQYPQLMVLTLESTHPAMKVYERAGWIPVKDGIVKKLNKLTREQINNSELDTCLDIYQSIIEQHPEYQSIPMIENELLRERLIERDPSWTSQWEEMVMSTRSEFDLKDSTITTPYYKPIHPLSELLNEPPTGLSIQFCQQPEREVLKHPEQYQPQMQYYPLMLDGEGNLTKPFFFHLETYEKNYLAICYDGKILQHEEKKSFINPNGYLRGSFKHLIGINTADFHYLPTTTLDDSKESSIIILDKLPDRLLKMIPNSNDEKQKNIMPLSNNPSSFFANLNQATSDERSVKKRGREENEVNKPDKRIRFLEQPENENTQPESDTEFSHQFI